jgi:predicted RNA-binding Zn-ribbon protein involved in translation (DUF1610 family)
MPDKHLCIIGVREKRKAALFAYKSQDGERIYGDFRTMESYRGRDWACGAAEALVHPSASTALRSCPACGATIYRPKR